MTEFFNMGGYAFFVWTSYGVTFAVLLVNFIWPLRKHRQLIKLIKASQNRKAKLARRQQ